MVKFDQTVSNKTANISFISVRYFQKIAIFVANHP